MDSKLLDTLVCPICKGKSICQPDPGELICKVDRLAFPIRDGIPVMLEDEARALPADEEVVEPASVTGIPDAGGFCSRAGAGLERPNRLERFGAQAAKR